MLTDKGYGFINLEKGALFFHRAVVPDISFDAVREGEAVEYEACRVPKGQTAKSAKPGVGGRLRKRVQTVTCRSSTPCWQH